MIKDIDSLIKQVTKEIRSFTDIAVVGMSGGADSTLVTVLCAEALGAKNVYGVHMPYGELDYDKFNANSVKIATRLGVYQKTISIRSSVNTLTLAMKDLNLSNLNLGNMKSRIRMVALYSMACSVGELKPGKKVRVMGTGNVSEDGIGYQTKFGDSGCDIFPIGSLFKSEVYQLLSYFRDKGIITEDMIDRVPSAGLWDGQLDIDEIGYTYDEMEPALRTLLAGKNPSNEFEKEILVMHENGLHKTQPAPVIKLRKFCD